MIRLSRLTDYAVTLLTQMVGGEKKIWSASELAEKTGLTLPTTSKVLKQLSKSGIIAAQRGATGGYHLEKSAAEIPVASIIEAMDGPIALTDCAGESEHSCSVETICPMSGNWDRVNRAVRRALLEVSLADMAVPQPKSHKNRPALAVSE